MNRSLFWQGMGWSVEKSDFQGSSRNNRRVNGKLILTRYSKFHQPAGTQTFFGITKHNIDLLEQHGGFLVIILGKARDFAVIPISDISAAIGRTEDRGGSETSGWSKKFNVNFEEILESRRLLFIATGGTVDITNRFRADQLLSP